MTWQAVGDQIVLLDLEASHYVELNASGAVLFRLLDEGRTDQELADALVERYGLSAAQASEDVTEFLTTLAQRDLLA